LTILLIGLAAGMLLNPYGLARLFPDAYERILLGGDPQVGRQIEQLQRKAAVNLTRLQSTGGADAAATTEQDDIAAQLQALRVQQMVARTQHSHRLVTHALALTGAIILLMGLEALLLPRRQPRVALLRVTLAAGLLALFTARADWLQLTPWLLVLTPAAAGLVLAVLPVKRGQPSPRDR
jgi:hypothetical protein